MQAVWYVTARFDTAEKGRERAGRIEPGFELIKHAVRAFHVAAVMDQKS
jgi:hypothetical protein